MVIVGRNFDSCLVLGVLSFQGCELEVVLPLYSLKTRSEILELFYLFSLSCLVLELHLFGFPF